MQLIKFTNHPTPFPISISIENTIEEKRDIAEKTLKFIEDGKYMMLASNQIEGIDGRFVVMNFDPFIMFEPTIVSTSDKIEIDTEWCYSLTGYSIKVKRPNEIRVRFTNVNGERETRKYSGLTSRVMQRKIDFLDGIMPWTKVSRYHRETSFRRWKNIIKNNKV